MNKDIRQLHNVAMDINDLGKRAKKEGDLALHRHYLEVAYLLEKESALRHFASQKRDFWRHTLLRSAAWMAIDIERLEDAEHLAELAIQDNPSEYERGNLQEVLNKVLHEKQVAGENKQHLRKIIGLLTLADWKNKLIEVVINELDQTQSIAIENDTLSEIAATHLGKPVRVLVQENDSGLPILHDIQRAA